MEEKVLIQNRMNIAEKPSTPLCFETHTQKGYSSLVQFLSDIFCLHKQMRKLKWEDLSKKLDLLQEMLQNTSQSVKQYPMNCFLDLPLSIIERAILIILIRRRMAFPPRGVELEDVLLLLGDYDQTVLEEVFSFFILKKGILRQSSFIEEQYLNSCILKKAITFEKTEPKSKKTVCQAISPQSIRKQLDEFIIGQNEAKEKLSVAFFEHLLKCDLLNENQPFYKNNVFLIGPTGTGKTYLCRMLASIMKVPFLHVDMSQYTASGYVGNSVKDIIANLAEITKAPQGKLPISIVFLDEIDKITSKDVSNNGRDIRGTSVQEELLRILETRKMRVERNNSFRADSRTYDISKVFFVAAGACSGLERVVNERLKKNQGVGFISAKTIPAQEKVISQDLLEYGFLPEFLSRFSYIAQLIPLTQKQLTDVILRSKNNILAQYKELFAACKHPLRFSQSHAKELAKKAYSHELGVRALNQLVTEEMTQRLNRLQYKLLLEKEDKV